MADLSRENNTAIEILMKMNVMWGLTMFRDLQLTMGKWRSSEKTQDVLKCIDNLFENHPKKAKLNDVIETVRDFIVEANKMMHQLDEIRDVVRKMFATIEDSSPLSKCIQRYVDET